MKTVHDFIRDHLFRQCGLCDSSFPLHLIQSSQWSVLFARYMRNRLTMGFFRYGDNRSPGPYANVPSAMNHLHSYLQTGNQEHLVDAANLCMVEFMTGNCHPTPYFKAADDSEHTPRKGRE